jgi:beta-lactamase regulating signal transducer with metallopeptidase domain/uncharacterized GH25 family protein
MSWTTLLWPWLLCSALTSSLILGPALAAMRLLRQPAEWILVAQLALIACVAAPLLQSLPGLSRWQLALRRSEPAVQVAEGPGLADLARSDRPRQPRLVGDDPALPRPERSDGELASAAGASASLTGLVGSIPWIALACTLYLAAVGALALRWLVGLGQLARLSRRTPAAPEAVHRLLLAVGGKAARNTAVRVSDEIAVPITFSWRRPVIVVPRALLQPGQEDALRAGLAHEWSHVAHGDIWWWHLATLLQVVVCHQPLVWLLRRRLRLAQDHLADERAAGEVGADVYAEQLLQAARNRGSWRLGAALGLHGARTNLARRVAMMLDDRHPLRQRCRRSSLGAALAVCAALLGLSTLVVVSQPERATAQVERAAEKAPPEAATKEVSPDSLTFPGRVVERDTKQPLEGATVTVRRSALTSAEDRLLEETQHSTNSKGEYEFRITQEQAANPRLYLEVDVRHPSHVQRNVGYSYELVRKDARLGERPFYEEIALVPGESIQGQLLSPEGNPVANAEVQVYSEYVGADQTEYGSWGETRSDEQGRFKTLVATPGAAVLWLIPDNYVPETHLLDTRGDLGRFTLKEGIRLKGRVLNEAGTPLTGVPVEANSIPSALRVGGHYVADRIRRQSTTDAEGAFELAPLPPGKYDLAPIRFEDNGHNHRFVETPAVFLPQEVVLASGVEPTPLEIRGLPSVLIEGQILDSQGKPTRGHYSRLWAKFAGKTFHSEVPCDESGRVSVRVPKGLEEAKLYLQSNVRSALRHRLAPGGPVSNQTVIELGKLDSDVHGIEILRYAAPILVLNAVTEDGRPAEGFKPRLSYITMDNPKDPKARWISGVEGDVNFEKQENGGWRSDGMLPDEEVIVRVEADGYEPLEQIMRFAEGSETELKATLKKAAAQATPEKPQ